MVAGGSVPPWHRPCSAWTTRHLLDREPIPTWSGPTPLDVQRFLSYARELEGRRATELAYLRVGFPTCWCVTAVRPELLAAAEPAYREQWGHTSAAGQGAPAAELAAACAGWLIRGDALVEAAGRGTGDHFDRLATRDWRQGTLTARERLVHRLVLSAVLTRGATRCTGWHSSLPRCAPR